ncbi:MAG: HEAT repeat domain-containing protein, partial [Planctomycetota bacterium]
EDDDARIRAAAAEALARLGGPGAVDALQGALEDNDRFVAAAAARGLAAIGDPRTRDRLAAMLAAPGTDPEVRVALVLGLGQSRDPEAEPALSKVALDADNHRRLRQYAVRSLAMLADRAGQKTLRALLAADPPARMTLLPLRYLDLGDDDETFRVLKWWATHGAPRHEQSMASERIGELGTPAGTRFLCGGHDVFDNYTRWACIWPLIRSRSATVRRSLVELLRSRRRSLRSNAAVALGGRRDPAVIEALIQACSDPAAGVRIAAATSLGECGDPAAAPALLTLLKEDDDIRAAHSALRALRLREFAELPDVAEALRSVRGTARDCGVPDGPPVVDQPANSFALRQFRLDYDDLRLPNLSYESGLCFDPKRGQVVQWGSHGRRYDTPQTALTWLYDVGSNTWRRPASRQAPPGICMTNGIAFDTSRGLAITTKSPTGKGGHGYVMYLRKFAAFSVPWVFDAAEEEWYPMRPPDHPGPSGHLHFDRRNDVMLCLKSGLKVYDPHANEWTALDPPGPAPGGANAAAYDPVGGRLILASGVDAHGRARTWAYDLGENRWAELAAKDPPPDLGSARMVYDAANDVMLAFLPGGDLVRVFAYHPRENRWEALRPKGPAPSYSLFDAAYDPARNVTVICGGEEYSVSGAPTIRETWTYRYRPVDEGRPSRDLALELDLGDDGSVSLSWSALDGVDGYEVHRGSGEHPWTAEFEKLDGSPLDGTAFTDPGPADGGRLYYRVTALAGGDEVAASNVVRTQPAPVREVFAARGADGTVALRWQPSAGPGVVGYNLYAAPVEPVDLWDTHFDPNEHAGEFEKLNDAPLEAPEFEDESAPVEPGTDATWPEPYER